MNKKRTSVIFFLGILMLFSLSCRFGQGLPGGQDIQISAEDVAAAATRAAEAAAAAGVLTDQAGEIAATAVAQGGEIAATAQIFPTQDPNIVGATALEQKLANIQPDANGNFVLVITEADFNEYIAGQTDGGIKTEGFNVENVNIDISGESAKLTGDVKEPLALPLTVEMSPEVQDNRLHFKIISAQAGIFPAPTTMLDLIELTANTALTEALAGLPSNMTLQNVQLGDGTLTITGHQS